MDKTFLTQSMISLIRQYDIFSHLISLTLFLIKGFDIQHWALNTVCPIVDPFNNSTLQYEIGQDIEHI